MSFCDLTVAVDENIVAMEDHTNEVKFSAHFSVLLDITA